MFNAGKGEVAKFASKFFSWTRENRMIDESSFKSACKYEAMSDWQKEIVREYIKGVMDVRNAKPRSDTKKYVQERMEF